MAESNDLNKSSAAVNKPAQSSEKSLTPDKPTQKRTRLRRRTKRKSATSYKRAGTQSKNRRSTSGIHKVASSRTRKALTKRAVGKSVANIPEKTSTTVILRKRRRRRSQSPVTAKKVKSVQEKIEMPEISKVDAQKQDKIEAKKIILKQKVKKLKSKVAKLEKKIKKAKKKKSAKKNIRVLKEKLSKASKKLSKEKKKAKKIRKQ